jgi:hypothetical protein
VGFIAGVIADLIHHSAKAGSRPSPDRPTPAASGHRNFIVRHWRGELPLWVSYWLINVLGNLCAIVAGVLLADILRQKTAITRWPCSPP